MKPILLGCAGLTLSAEERAFFREAQPFGFILFARNCESPAQLRRLVHDLRESTGREDTPVFVDQEGGRVARLKPPHWPAMPAAGALGALYDRNPAAGLQAARLHAQITAAFLRDVGIDGNCAPLLDLSVPDTSAVMGDRTYSARLDTVIALGLETVRAYLASGVFPVVKHMPGHGRVKVDPHEVLPFVEADMELLRREDFAPFRALAAEVPMAMNCHVVFRAIDADHPVSLSLKAHREILRGEIGYDGLIFSDDLAMKALSLPLKEIGLRALEGGADVVLYCPGVLADGVEVCAALPEMAEASLARWHAAQARRAKAASSRADEQAQLEALAALLA